METFRKMFSISEIPELEGIDQLAFYGGKQLIPTFRGWHRSLQQKVIIRLFPTALADDPARRLALDTLAHQIMHCRHPGVAEWLEFNKITWQEMEYYCFTSKWFSDESLKDSLMSNASLDEENVLLVAEHTAEALGHFWDSCHIAHGNLKPRNILIDEAGVLKIEEFGLHVLLALIAPNGLNVGTPFFMAPELRTGHAQPNHLSDIYALGMTVSCLLAGSVNGTGVPSAGNEDHSQTNMKVCISLSPEIGEIIRLMTAERPEERFQSWRAVRSVVNEFNQTRVIEAGHDK